MKRYIIEREIPDIGAFQPDQLQGAAAKSNEALAQLAPKVQWIHSYVAADQTFCVDLADSEADILRHAEISGFPATRITEIGKIIDPTTAG